MASAEALLRRVERLEVEHADARAPAASGSAGSAPARSRSSPGPPGAVEQRREQDVLAALQRVGVDAEQAEQARHGGRDALAQELGVARRRRRRARRATCSIDTGSPAVAARRVDGEVGGLAQARDALRRPGPTRPGPSPQLGLLLRVVLGRPRPCRRASSWSTHGAEVGGRELGEGQQQVAEVALRIDDDRRDAVDRRLLEQATGTARSCRCPSCPTQTAWVARSRES